MCTFPQLIRNKKYSANKKNGGIIPAVPDKRVYWVPTPCGNCMECRKKKARDWQIRLTEDIKEHTNGKFITLTFNNESYKKLANEYPKLQGYDLDNMIAIRAMRLFNERYRKKYKKALRHWTVTELGHNGTENIHLHGIIWPQCTMEEIEKIWQYGYVWKGKKIKDKLINYVSAQTINYCIKYVSKVEEIHKCYQPVTLTSPGIGKNYIKTYNAQLHKYNNKETKETYRTSTGHKISLPSYYRNKIYTDQEKEKLWINLLDKEQRWVDGRHIDISQGEETYNKILKEAQEKSIQLGYTVKKSWNRQQYEKQRRILMQEKRKQNTK